MVCAAAHKEGGAEARADDSHLKNRMWWFSYMCASPQTDRFT